MSERYYNTVQESLRGHGTSLVLLMYVWWLGSLAVSADAAQGCLTKQNQPSTLCFSGLLASILIVETNRKWPEISDFVACCAGQKTHGHARTTCN